MAKATKTIGKASKSASYKGAKTAAWVRGKTKRHVIAVHYMGEGQSTLCNALDVVEAPKNPYIVALGGHRFEFNTGEAVTCKRCLARATGPAPAKKATPAKGKKPAKKAKAA